MYIHNYTYWFNYGRPAVVRPLVFSAELAVGRISLNQPNLTHWRSPQRIVGINYWRDLVQLQRNAPLRSVGLRGRETYRRERRLQPATTLTTVALSSSEFLCCLEKSSETALLPLMTLNTCHRPCYEPQAGLQVLLSPFHHDQMPAVVTLHLHTLFSFDCTDVQS